MLQVKDPQEVFDELVKPMIDLLAEGLNEESTTALNELVFRAYTLGEMYGTVSTCLARQVPIEKELWDNLATKHFVRGDVDDVIVVDPEEEDEDNQPMTLEQAQEIYTQCDPTFAIPLLIKNGFNPADWT